MSSFSYDVNSGITCEVNSAINTYRPATNTWRALTLAGQYVPQASAWSGSEILMLANEENTTGMPWPSTHYYTQLRYTPTNDTWTTAAQPPYPFAVGWALMAGNAELTFGQRLQLLLRYFPATDTWEEASIEGAPSSRVLESLTWTGAEALVWGGSADYGAGPLLNDGAGYDPATDTWNPIPVTAGTPTPRMFPAFVWAGSELLIWSGALDVVPTQLATDGARFHR